MSLIEKLLKESIKEVLTGVERSPEKELETRGFTIVILQRGWVVVGEYFKEGVNCRLENASVIRSWGTSKGLGELALNGPTDKTTLDKCGTVRFHSGAEVCTMDCKTSWS